MTCQAHADHDHVHGENCGHTRVQHEGHIDYLHDGHLHSEHGDHYDEHSIRISDANPDACAPLTCSCDHSVGNCTHEKVPHGDHVDFLVNGRLHYRHGDHCDDHGPLALA